MGKGIPHWALEAATAQDRQRAADAHRKGTWQITWPDVTSLRAWARQHGWPAPWFVFERRFIEKMLESDDNFKVVVEDSGLQVQIPLEQYKVSDDQLRALDAMYDERADMGVLGSRPTGWGSLVEELREIRRAIEAGVVVEVDGRKLKSVGSFLTWAHERYHMLEDGYDSWIGDDKS